MTDAVYDRIGKGYARFRQPDPRIAARIDAAIGDARSILNVGAGTGSYEPAGAIAVEPSRTMIDQRVDRARTVQATAQALPIRDDAFDAALAVMTVHHWPDRSAGYRELCRVAPRRIVLTYDPVLHGSLWLTTEYLADAAAGVPFGPSVDEVADGIGATRVETIPIPHDCIDGLMVAYWRRPEAYLDPRVRATVSGLAMADPALLRPGLERLAADLASGAWHERHADLLALDELDLGLRLVVANG